MGSPVSVSLASFLVMMHGGVCVVGGYEVGICEMCVCVCEVGVCEVGVCEVSVCEVGVCEVCVCVCEVGVCEGVYVRYMCRRVGAQLQICTY